MLFQYPQYLPKKRSHTVIQTAKQYQKNLTVELNDALKSRFYNSEQILILEY